LKLEYFFLSKQDEFLVGACEDGCAEVVVGNSVSTGSGEIMTEVSGSGDEEWGLW